MSGGHIEVETPEHVVFHYELAGVMSRMLAGAFDFMIQALIAIGIVLGFFVVWGGGLTDLSGAPLAVLSLLLFVDVWGYSVLFEIFMRGRTPGKMRAKLRVIREGGYPLTASDVMVRNLLRAADFLPMAYGLGLIVMCSNAKCKRIGDFVAGTIVIHDAPKETADAIAIRRIAVAPAAPEAVEALRRSGVHQLPREQIDLIESFLQRRSTLDPEARYRLARQIAEPIGAKLGMQVGAPEKFLPEVLHAYREATKGSL